MSDNPAGTDADTDSDSLADTESDSPEDSDADTDSDNPEDTESDNQEEPVSVSVAVLSADSRVDNPADSLAATDVDAVEDPGPVAELGSGAVAAQDMDWARAPVAAVQDAAVAAG